MDKRLETGLRDAAQRLIDNLHRAAANFDDYERLALQHADRLRARDDHQGAEREVAAAEKAGRAAADCLRMAARFEQRLTRRETDGGRSVGPAADTSVLDDLRAADPGRSSPR